MLGFKSLVTVVALCAVCFDTSAKWQLVAAQDSDAADVVVEADPEAGDEKKEAAAEGEESSEEKAQAFMDSAQDLQDKLDQLNALLESKGDSIDPELKERILGLKSQLGGLGLDMGASSPGSNKELTEFLIQCLDLTVRRVGKSHKTINTMAKLAEAKYTKEDAAKSEFWRMAISCISEAGEDDLKDFKDGSVKKLPKAFVEKAQSPEGEKKVLDLDDQLWQELKAVVPQLVKAYTGNTEETPPPTMYGLLAMIPLGLGVAFMAKIYFDMQKKKEADAERKAKKSAKKSS